MDTKSVFYHLRSKEVAQKWIKVFGFDTIEEFRENMESVLEKLKSDPNLRPRYNAAFEVPHLICDFISPDEIGIVN